MNYISSIQLTFIIHIYVLWFTKIVEHKTHESTHHLKEHDYRLYHFPNWRFNYNSTIEPIGAKNLCMNDPLVEIYFQLSTKILDGSTYFIDPNYFLILIFFCQKGYVVESELVGKGGFLLMNPSKLLLHLKPTHTNPSKLSRIQRQ